MSSLSENAFHTFQKNISKVLCKSFLETLFKFGLMEGPNQTPLSAKGVRMLTFELVQPLVGPLVGCALGTTERGQGAKVMLMQADRLLHELVLVLQDSRPGEGEEGSRGAPCPPSHSSSGGN